MRYIELNPVRAVMVQDLAHYRWTSYRANALGQAAPLLVPHPVRLALGATDNARRTAYYRLFRYRLDDQTVADLRLAVIQSQRLGTERFYATIERMAGSRETGPRGPGGRGDLRIRFMTVAGIGARYFVVSAQSPNHESDCIS